MNIKLLRLLYLFPLSIFLTLIFWGSKFFWFNISSGLSVDRVMTGAVMLLLTSVSSGLIETEIVNPEEDSESEQITIEEEDL